MFLHLFETVRSNLEHFHFLVKFDRRIPAEKWDFEENWESVAKSLMRVSFARNTTRNMFLHLFEACRSNLEHFHFLFKFDRRFPAEKGDFEENWESVAKSRIGVSFAPNITRNMFLHLFEACRSNLEHFHFLVKFDRRGPAEKCYFEENWESVAKSLIGVSFAPNITRNMFLHLFWGSRIKFGVVLWHLKFWWNLLSRRGQK
jgi:hypothetical protein